MRKSILILAALALMPMNAARADDADGATHGVLPRFASLRSGEANLRTGPGTRYPIEWVYTRRSLPVEITAEYDVWRRVRDPEGIEGWFHQTELTARRSALVTGGPQELRDDSDDKSAVVAHLDNGAMGELLSCAPDWCELKFEGIKGYLRKTQFWGAFPGETFG